MCEVVSLTAPKRRDAERHERLLAELDDLSLYRLARQARRQGTSIRTPRGEAPPRL